MASALQADKEVVMARRYEDECVSCGLPCLGSACPNRNVLHIDCDNCDEEITEEVYLYDGKEYCKDCLLEALIVDGVIEKEG